MGSCSNSPSVSSSALTPTHSFIITRCYRALCTRIRFNFHQTDGDLYKSQTILNHNCALSYCIEQNTLLRGEVLTLVLLKIQIFWDVVQCWPLKTANILQEVTASILSAFRELVGIAEILGPQWKWRKVGTLKCLYPYTQPQHVTSQKSVIVKHIAVPYRVAFMVSSLTHLEVKVNSHWDGCKQQQWSCKSLATIFLSTHNVTSQKTWIFTEHLHYKHSCTTWNW
jgi:hypothetical protein